MIDGQGSGWWHMDGLTHGRPRLIEPMYCKNFSMVGVTVQNPPFWAMHPYVCDNVLFENITFSAPPNSPNTDGIDPDSCSNVVIRNFNVIHCGDDAVAIKSGKDAAGRAFNKPSYNILIEGNTTVSAFLFEGDLNNLKNMFTMIPSLYRWYHRSF